MKIRLWGTEPECALAARLLMATPGLVVLSVSGPYADRGASVLVRVFVEARLDPPPPAPEHQRASAPAQRRTSCRDPRALRPGGPR